MKWPTMDEFAQMVADKALDEVEYNGKTIREWTEIILATASEDTISRQAAIEAMKNLCEECDADHCGECRIDYPDKDAKSVLEALPPAEPQRMRAKWIATTSLQEGQITWRDYKCSNCSHHRGKPMNYCEVCGAKMER